MTVDFTHDPSASSWFEPANAADTPFPLQNLPLARWRRDGQTRIGVALGDQLLDLSAMQAMQGDLTALADADFRRRLRHQLFLTLQDPDSPLRQQPGWWVPLDRVEFQLPFEVGDYTDFYASRHHAARVGSMFRPEQPLLPNYDWVPIGYHGRASSLVVSGSEIARPSGQLPGETPIFAPTRMLDYELEVGFWVGAANPQGKPIPIAEAGRAWLGLSLLNDWSARDIQRWEYQPLGPFLAKSFATSVSPWVITPEALAPFRAPAAARPVAPLAYLSDESDQRDGALDLELEVWLSSSAGPPARLSRAHFREMDWTPAQLLAHHASNGCPLRIGDLLASGTVSGPRPEDGGCLLEQTWQGAGLPRRAVQLPSGEERFFLEDGDQVVLTGWARRPGFRSIGLGRCTGKIVGGS